MTPSKPNGADRMARREAAEKALRRMRHEAATARTRKARGDATGGGGRAAARIVELMLADPRDPIEIEKAAAISPGHVACIIAGRNRPNLETTARLLAALGKRWADLDEPEGDR